MKKTPKKPLEKEDNNSTLNKTNNRETSIDKIDSGDSAGVRNSEKGWDIFRGGQDELEKSKIVEVLDIGMNEPEVNQQTVIVEKVILIINSTYGV